MVDEPTVHVRYLVDDVAASVDFYTTHFGFTVNTDFPPVFADVVRGNLRLLLSGPTSSAGRAMADGEVPRAGGWNRIHLHTDDLESDVARLRDGQEALRAFDAHSPALVLLDMGLPHVHGLELLAQIRKKPTWNGVSVVMLTADGDQTHICKAIMAGASDYVLKPFKREPLLARLARFRAPGLKRRTA